VFSVGADGGAGALGAACVADERADDAGDARGEEEPGALVFGFLLAPDEPLHGFVARDDFADAVGVERVELLDADDRGGGVLLGFGAGADEVEVDLARAKHDARDFFRILDGGVVEDFLEAGIGEILGARDGILGAQEALGRHDDERLAVGAVDLAAEGVEILGRRGGIDDLHVFLRAELEEALEAGAGVLGALAFVAVREEHDDRGGAAPLRLGGGDELVDDDLRAIREIAELGLPDAEHRGVVHRVAVVETEHGVFGERAIINAEGLLLRRDVLERNEWLAGLFVVEDGVAVAEGATAAVLAGDTHGSSLDEEGTKCQRLGESPIEGAAFLPNLQAAVEDRALDFLDDIEAGGNGGDGFDDALAFGSLLLEGTPVRVSGQDSRRGTFSHRNAVLYDEKSREPFIPLQHITPKQETFCIYNSPLSEYAVLGFDYGYSMDYPSMLCIWEAQFGDFSNGAQIIIDQFIASAEAKWRRPTSIVMLLPHGYEGQGPEHSSARLERFLQLCAQENMQVVNPTTPAQYFHSLRRQIHRAYRKPLVIMTPKSLLRSEDSVSRTEDFTNARFEEILDDPAIKDPKKITRIVFCSGKVYFDLVRARAEAKQDATTAIIRIEQLYPLHADRIREVVARYKSVKRFVWCQEEPENQGAWLFLAPRIAGIVGSLIGYAGRSESASPAVGSYGKHKDQLVNLLKQAFEI